MRHAMIMAGGSGTRLWPLSRRETPKQLAELIDGKSLLEIAARRLEGLIPAERTWICAAEYHRDAMRRQLPRFRNDRFLGEPEGRDTAAAVGFAAAVLEAVDPGCTMCVLTADHLIEPEDAFRKRVESALDLAEAGERRLVTFSIKPTRPAIGFGYIEKGEAIPGFEGAYRVARYVEKPDIERAKEYVASGRHGWNSGMFVWKASTALEALETFEPEIGAAVRKIGAAWSESNRASTIESVYRTIKKISVDYAVMEPASTDERFEVCTVEVAVSWKDVGSWPSLAETIEPDASGNRLAGDAEATLVDCEGVFIFGQRDRHIAVLGCRDLIIVETRNATLVVPRDQAERLKELVERLPHDLR
jgi:mannose-1-phosphate guanylyltransferase